MEVSRLAVLFYKYSHPIYLAFIYILLLCFLGGYDFHFIVKSLSALKKAKLVETVSLVPKSTEKFLAITINGRIRFLDSLAFTQSSLDNLVESTPRDQFKILSQEFATEASLGYDIEMLKRKGV